MLQCNRWVEQRHFCWTLEAHESALLQQFYSVLVLSQPDQTKSKRRVGGGLVRGVVGGSSWCSVWKMGMGLSFR